MFKLFKFLLPPIVYGLAIAFLFIWLYPQLTHKLLPELAMPKAYTSKHISFADAVDKASPAVVTIFSESISTKPRYLRNNTTQDLGSGVIMSEDGYILTNYHVVKNADQIMIILTDGRRFNDVQVIGFDPITDLAVLKIDAQHLPTIPVDDTFIPRVGDVVLAIGNPLNLGQTISQGIISATDRQTLTGNSFNNLLQMDAAINLGNSGGALVNSNGVLVGITSAQFKTRYNIDIQGISFAVPYSLAHDVMNKIINDGRVTRGYLGFTGTPINSNGVEVADLHTPIVGLKVSKLDPLGPAWDAGMKDGDIIVSVAEQPVNNPNATLQFIGKTKPGTVLNFEVYRDGKKQFFNVKVAELETKVN